MTAALVLAGMAPGRLRHAARLYVTLADAAGNSGARHYLTDLPPGAAVFALSAPGAVFSLVDSDAAAQGPLVEAGAMDAGAIDAWFGALMECPGLPRGDGGSLPLEPGRRAAFAAATRITTREVVWLKADRPILRYAGDAGPDAALLLAGRQVDVELTAEGEVAALTTVAMLRSLPADTLGALSGAPAALIARKLVAAEQTEQRRWQETLAVDESDSIVALQRLRDIAAFQRRAPAASGMAAKDELAGALAVIAAAEGFTLTVPSDDDPGKPLFDRLRRFANATGFRYREIALNGAWWREEGPPFVGAEAASGRPLSLIWRGGWRIVDPRSLADTPVDAAAAQSLQPRGYMIYAALPDQVTPRQLWQFAAFGVRRDIVRLLFAMATTIVASLVMPVAIGAILGAAIPDGRLGLLSDMLLLVLAAAIGSAGFQLVKAAALIRLGTHIDRRLQASVWDRVLRLRTSFFRSYVTGDLALRILSIDAVRRILSGVTIGATISSLFSLASLGVMLIYDAALTGFAVAYAAIAALVLFALGRRQMLLQRIVYQRQGIVSGMLVEMLGGIAKLRIAAAEQRAFSRWSNAFAEQRANDARSARLGALQKMVANSLPILGAIGIFAIAAGGDHLIDVGSFAAFNSAFGQFTAAIVGLAGVLNSAIEAVPLFARVRPVLEAPLEVERSRTDPGRLGGSLAVRNLSFRYSEEGPWILEDIGFEVRPGESLAIAGPSGSGKSTLLRLLLGFETPSRGGVYYDGRDLDKLDLRLVRQQIGSVLENAGLVPGSLYENIAGSTSLSRDQVMEAVRQAGLADDVAAMPMGLESFVTEGGGQLSGGQRQRVMIARALVRKPRLIFFDEATSALDNRTQAIVGRTLAATNATRIVIAHRLSTIRDADRILVLERGRIVESGTYEELTARAGLFHRLARRQML